MPNNKRRLPAVDEDEVSQPVEELENEGYGDDVNDDDNDVKLLFTQVS
jgi:hypothetical protein